MREQQSQKQKNHLFLELSSFRRIVTFVNSVVDPIKPKFHPIPINTNDIKVPNIYALVSDDDCQQE